MDQRRLILSIDMSLIVYTAVSISAQLRYTVTDLGAFQTNAIAGPYVVGSENDLPVRLNIDTGEKLFLGHYGHGGVANNVLATGEAIGTLERMVDGRLCDTATFWNSAGRFTGLQGSLPSYGVAINASWTMSGSTNCVGGQRAMRWWPDGRTEECVGPTSRGVGVDSQHRVWGHTGSLHEEAMRVWDVDGQVYEPAGLGPSGNRLYAVNSVGVAAGSHESGTKFVATRVTLTGGSTELPSLGGNAPYCHGLAINAHGDVGGTCTQLPFTFKRAVLWPANGAMVDLSRTIALSNGWQLVYVAGVSDDGVMVALASQSPSEDSPRRGFLLSPIPAKPVVSLAVNQSAFQPGQTLQATITTQDAAGLQLYVGAIFPDSDTLLLLTTLSPLNGQVVRLSTSNPAIFPTVTVPAQPTQSFAHTFTGLETPGTYHLVAALVPPGAFQDGIIHEADLVGFDWKAITVNATSPLHTKMLAIRDRHLSPLPHQAPSCRTPPPHHSGEGRVPPHRKDDPCTQPRFAGWFPPS
jgi:hypothetical protein